MAKVFICGDISNTIGSDSFISPRLKDIIKDSDYSIGNLEGVELMNNDSISGSPFQTEGTCRYLKESGFNLMLLANNHIADGGKDRLIQTIKTIEKCGMDYIGASDKWEIAYRPIIKEIDNCKIAFLNVCEAQTGCFYSPRQEFGYAWMMRPTLLSDISRLKNENDHVIVFVHAGLEHYSLPLSEIRDFYRRLCNAGASCVIGGHPHKAQGFEYYNNSFIAYSLGNFFFPRANNAWPEENTSFALSLCLAKEGKLSVTVIHHSMNGFIVDTLQDKTKQVDVDQLCKDLGDGYSDAVDEMCVNSYETLCQGLLIESLCGEKEHLSFIESIKNLLRRSLFRKRYVVETAKRRELLLLRLFENETYRFVITKALQIKTRDGK